MLDILITDESSDKAKEKKIPLQSNIQYITIYNCEIYNQKAKLITYIIVLELYCPCVSHSRKSRRMRVPALICCAWNSIHRDKIPYATIKYNIIQGKFEDTKRVDQKK